MSIADHITATELQKARRRAAQVTNSRDIAMESVGFAVAEGVSMATALGVVAVADQIAPGIINGAAHVVSKGFVLPFLDPIEKGLGKICHLEECKRDDSIPREERAERLAKTLVVFGVAWVASMAAKLETRRLMNRSLGVDDPHQGSFFHLSRKEAIIVGTDEVVHYGSLLAANTMGASVTDDFIRTTQGVLEKCGVPKEKAHELAAYTMVWEMPNLLGLLAGLGAVYATHKYPGTLGMKPPHG